MYVSGDLACTANSYYYTYHASDSEPRWHKTKNVHIWKRDAGGEWKLHVDIWNSDVPLDAFGDE
jgi:ketosteroid isomerase-like protein